MVKAEHLAQLTPLFAALSESHRRTGIDLTLHRISRTVHAITRETTAITARVGRTIQGRVLPMLLNTNQPDAQLTDLIADTLREGLMLIGPPNVGKTSVPDSPAYAHDDANRSIALIQMCLSLGAAQAGCCMSYVTRCPVAVFCMYVVQRCTTGLF